MQSIEEAKCLTNEKEVCIFRCISSAFPNLGFQRKMTLDERDVLSLGSNRKVGQKHPGL